MFDWTVPKEWNIRDAYIKNSQGKKIVDFHSTIEPACLKLQHACFKKKLSFDELKEHLFTLAWIIRSGSRIGRHIIKKIGDFA